MDDSILISIKKMLGITDDNVDFDDALIVNINSVFTILYQLGIGPEGGFKLEDEDTSWDEYMDESDNLESVKSYMYLKVKMLFDPPTNASLTGFYDNMIKELEWRLTVAKESNDLESEELETNEMGGDS